MIFLLLHLSIFFIIQYGESLTPASKEETSRKGELVEQKDGEVLPYDTTTKTGKIAAALMTGKVKVLLLNV